MTTAPMSAPCQRGSPVASVATTSSTTVAQAVGTTSKDGMKVEERPTSVPDLLATLCKALGIDPEKKNLSNVNRPISIVDKSANPVTEVLA